MDLRSRLAEFARNPIPQSPLRRRNLTPKWRYSGESAGFLETPKGNFATVNDGLVALMGLVDRS